MTEDEIMRLSEAATPGPWAHKPWVTGGGDRVEEDRELTVDGVEEFSSSLSIPDADLIVALVNGLRAGTLVHRDRVAQARAEGAEEMQKVCLAAAAAWDNVGAELLASRVIAQHDLGTAQATARGIGDAIRSIPISKESDHGQG